MPLSPEKERERHLKRHPTKVVVCPMCGNAHESYGQTGRKSDVCSVCYDTFRQAEVMLAAIKYRSKKFGYPYDLDTKWLFDKLNQPCPRTGVTFNLQAKSPTMKDRPFDGPSVDKIKPDEGYTKANCQVVIWWYNCMKQRFSDKDVLELCKLVVTHGSIPQA